jgi:hypothetical protein
MTEVSAEERQRAKASHQSQATRDGYIAGFCTIAAAITRNPGWGIPGGLAVILATYHRSMAQDPPRADFDVVWETEAELNEELLPADEPERTLHRFAAEQLIAMDAVYALWVALERYDGATGAGDADGTERQAQAVGYNGSTAAAHLDSLVALAPSINDLWSSARDAADRSWDSVSLDEEQNTYIEICGPERSELTGEPVLAVARTVSGAADDLLVAPETDLEHPVLDATEPPAEPDPLLGEEALGGLTDLSESLRQLVT